jgi:hypothetical protein
MTKQASIFNDLHIVKEIIYDKCGLNLTNLNPNVESAEYGACSFLLNNLLIQHRVSKTTATKTGQFVTIWHRNSQGITEPYSITDNIDFFVITARSGDNLGQFIFPTAVLASKGIISGSAKKGKRGIRVYPPWDVTTNKQAEKTQLWQTKYFISIKNNCLDNLKIVQKLFENQNDI